MMRYSIGLFIFISCSITWVSCGEDFFSATKEIDLGEITEDFTVVARLVNTELDTVEDLETLAHLGVLVSKTKVILDDDNFELIENGQVKLSSDNGLDLPFDYNESGYYIPDARLELTPQTNYTLTVDLPSADLISAKLKTPSFTSIGEVSIIKEDIKEGDFNVLDRISVNIEDPEGDNYYLFKVYYKYDSKLNRGFTNEGYLYNYNSLFTENANLFNDDLFDNSNHKLEFWSERNLIKATDREEYLEPDEIIVFLWSLSKEEYDFRLSLDRNRNSEDNPFAEPGVVFSNIDNGIGVFTLSHIERKVVKW